MAVAGMVLGIVACAWLVGVHRKNKALRARTEELEYRLKDVESRLETHLGRLNDLEKTVELHSAARIETCNGIAQDCERIEQAHNELASKVDTIARVTDAHSEQIINLAQRADDLEAPKPDHIPEKSLQRLLQLAEVVESGKVLVTKRQTKGGK